MAKIYTRILQNIDWWKWALIGLITLFAIITRFAPTTPSNGMVFDESYFVPQVESYIVGRYFFDPHPPLGRFFLYLGTEMFNPEAAQMIDPSLLGNKVDGYQDPLNIEGIRFFPKVFGVMIPILIFLAVYELLRPKKKPEDEPEEFKIDKWFSLRYLVPFLAGLMAVFENTFILESRYGLMSQILIAFMLLTVLCTLKYYFSPGRAWKWFVLAALSLGATVSVKWLGLSIAPFLLLLLLIKEYRIWQQQEKHSRVQLIQAVYNKLLILIFVGLAIYMGSYYWHFSRMQTYAPAADEVTESFLMDLKNGTNNTSFLTKFTDAQRLNVKYEDHVPELDYAKDGEIGSQWVTWPMMARPINYFQTTSDSGETYGFAYLIGNPLVWGLGLLGVITLTGVWLAKVLGAKFKDQTLDWGLVTALLFLFFANWVPFALISRVMYLYHYMPAVAISIVLFAVVLAKLVAPRLYDLLASWCKQLKKTNWLVWGSFLGKYSLGILFVLVIIVFALYAPLTYVQPINQEQFESKVLFKEWNMKWPGPLSSVSE